MANMFRKQQSSALFSKSRRFKSTKVSLLIKIEKIKRKYDKYELSFTTIANGLPEQVPNSSQHESHQYNRG